MIVFSIQQNVGAHDGNAHLNGDENHNNRGKEAVHIVILVAPDRGKDEEDLDEDRSKGKQAAHQNDKLWTCVEGSRRDRRRKRGHTARVVGISAQRPPDNRAQRVQRKTDEGPEESQHDNVSKGEVSQSSIRHTDQTEQGVHNNQDHCKIST